jgi:hypothetical protein
MEVELSVPKTHLSPKLHGSRASVSQVCNPTATLLAILQVHSELIFGSVSLNERPT